MEFIYFMKELLNMSTGTVKLSLLLMDYNVYPRHKISQYHVNELVDALEAGAKFPPVVYDINTHIIVDGFHRVAAFKHFFGVDCEIEAEALDCKDKGEIILKSVEFNSHHGLRFTAWDRARCISLARANKLGEEFMRKALNIPPERYEKLKDRIVPVRNEAGKFIRETQLKRGQENIAKKADGVYVTIAEEKLIESGGTTGLSPEIRIATLIRDLTLIEGKDITMLTITNKNIGIIKDLYELLGEAIERYENE